MVKQAGKYNKDKHFVCRKGSKHWEMKQAVRHGLNRVSFPGNIYRAVIQKDVANFTCSILKDT